MKIPLATRICQLLLLAPFSISLFLVKSTPEESTNKYSTLKYVP